LLIARVLPVFLVFFVATPSSYKHPLQGVFVPFGPPTYPVQPPLCITFPSSVAAGAHTGHRCSMPSALWHHPHPRGNPISA
jgi:hypothetical protein